MLRTLLAKTKISLSIICSPKPNRLQGEYMHLCGLGLGFRQVQVSSLPTPAKFATDLTWPCLFQVPGSPDPGGSHTRRIHPSTPQLLALSQAWKAPTLRVLLRQPLKGARDTCTYHFLKFRASAASEAPRCLLSTTARSACWNEPLQGFQIPPLCP